MRIRRLSPGDLEGWRVLFQAYLDFYAAEVAEDVIQRTWARCLAGDDGFLGLAAVDANDRIFGLAHVLFHPSTWSPTTYCYLEDLYVDATRRRSGAGRALIEAVYAEADARGCTRTYWVTMDGNQEARALYERVARRAPFVQYRR